MAAHRGKPRAKARDKDIPGGEPDRIITLSGGRRVTRREWWESLSPWAKRVARKAYAARKALA